MPAWEVHFRHGLDVRDTELLRLIIEVEACRRAILKMPLPPGIKCKVDRINIVRQIQGTTAIEGNGLTEEEVGRLVFSGEDADEASHAPSKVRDELEVLNAHTVHRTITESCRSGTNLRVTEQLVQDLHRLTTEGIDYEANVPGEYRRHNVTAGDYQSPPHQDVPRLMRQFIDLINSDAVTCGLGTLIRAVLAHFYLVSIHPFGDGNGRTARGLEACILYSGGYNTHGFYSLSNFYYKHRHEYISQLTQARFEHDGRLQSFVVFALQGFVAELDMVREQVLQFIRAAVYRDYLAYCYRFQQISPRCEALAQLILQAGPAGLAEPEVRTFSHPVVRELYRGLVSRRTIDRDLKVLTGLSLITVTDGHIQANLDFCDSLSG